MPRDDVPSPNPLLLAWVKEWLDTARERSSKGVTTYKHAYNALKSCPIAFTHPAELVSLKGFGPKLCDRLTAQLEAHCREHGLQMPENPQLRKRKGDVGETGLDGSAGLEPPVKKTKKAKQYSPVYRSGAYALILGLATLPEDAPQGLSKADLIAVAQAHSDASFNAPTDPTKFYTAWNSMKTLLQKELVYERGRPLKRYALTDDGWLVARSLAAADQPVAPQTDKMPSTTLSLPIDVSDDEVATSALGDGQPNEYADVVDDGPALSDDALLPAFAPIILNPGTFSVQMILDTREVRTKKDRDYMQEELAKRGVQPVTRSLELGDVLWVAKCHDPDLLSQHGAEGDEIVLDWILERKRLDDLITSIKDGRFREQKFRLRRSGVRNVIYLIEEIALDDNHFSKYEESVQSAIASTQVVDGYLVKKTQKMDDTIRYLATMTMMIQDLYERKTLKVIPTKVITARNYLSLLEVLRVKEPSENYYISYPAFASLVSKSESLTLGDLFLKMLMCTRGVTGEKAVEIQKRWRTPCEFIEAFEQLGPDAAGKKQKADLMAAHMNSAVARKKVAKVLSYKIAQVWNDA